MSKSIDVGLDSVDEAVRAIFKGPFAPIGVILSFIICAYMMISMTVVSGILYVYLPSQGKAYTRFVAGVFILVAIALVLLVANAGIFLLRLL